MESTRKQIAQLLPDPDLALQVPCRQPFLLHLVSQFLKILEDPDYSILSEGPESFAEGVHLGWDTPLPTTPHVFRPRLKQRQLDITEFEPTMQNYVSAEMSSDHKWSVSCGWAR